MWNNLGVCVTVLVLCCLGHQATAQTQNAPQLCNATNSMNFNPRSLSGSWYEVARSPVPTNSILCTQVDFTVQPNNVLSIDVTYSNTPDYPWVNQTMTANVTLNSSNTNGYNITYTLGQMSSTPIVYKLLDTDYTNYAYICGYANANNTGSYSAIILTRQRMVSTSMLNGLETAASSQYAGFSNSTMTLITQSTLCYASGADGSVPVLYAIFAFYYISKLLIC